MIIITALSAHAGFCSPLVITNVEKHEIKDDSENVKEVAEYLKKRQEALERARKEKKPQSSLKRFEIQFFSAGAMAYVTTWLLSRIFAEFTIDDASDLPDIYWMLIITNSVGMATYISVKDYYDVKRIRERDKDKYSKRKQISYKLSLIRKKF